MKKILFIISILLCSTMLSAQSVKDLPKYYIVGNDTIGIILSVEQCQKLDHDSDLLDLYRKMSVNCGNVEKGYIAVVNKLGEKITILELDIKNLKDQKNLQKDIVVNLQKQINDYKTKDKLNNEKNLNNEIIISGLKKDLKKQKRKTALGFGCASLIFIGSIVVLLTH